MVLAISGAMFIFLVPHALYSIVAGERRQFIQITDFHLDPQYTEGGDSSRMCHAFSDNIDSDVVTPYGNFRCDAPAILVESAINYLANVVPNPDFILWTGDSSPHVGEDDLSWDAVYANLRHVTQKIHSAFGDKIPVVPVLGNHDSFPADYFPDRTTTVNDNFYARYIKEGSFGDLLHDQVSRELFKKCGYYVMRNRELYAHHRIVQTFLVLNTNLYYNNKALNDNDDDPCGQLEWLNQTLRATDEMENVFIVAHVPPGYFELDVSYPFFSDISISQKFLKIVTEMSNANKIVAHFYGHTHTDTFRLFRDSQSGETRGLGFIASSLTPLMFDGGVNPSVRVYDYDPTTRKILTYSTHFLDLDKINNVTSESKVEDTSLPLHQRLNGKFDPDNFSHRIKREGSENSEFNSESDGPDTEGTVEAASGEQTLITSELNAVINDEDDDVVADINSEDKTGDVAAPKFTDESKLGNLPVSNSTSVEESTSSENTEMGSVAIETTTIVNANQTVPEENEEASKDDVETLNERQDEEEPSSKAEESEKTQNVTIKDNNSLASKWELAYDAVQKLNVSGKINDLSAVSMGVIYDIMVADGMRGKTFAVYRRANTVLHDIRKPCDHNCFAQHICVISNFLPSSLCSCLTKMSVSDMNVVRKVCSSAKRKTVEITTVNHLEDDSETISLKPKLNDTILKHKTIVVHKESSSESYGAAGKWGIAIGFFILLGAIVIGVLLFRQRRLNRYRAQEFLLTDSVFKYDGYSQLDAP